MGTTVHVPQTRDMIGDELSGDEALTALRHYGGRKLLLDAFARFRYADGFSHARSLGYQVVLGIVPFLVAVVGAAATVHSDAVGQVVELTLTKIVPGDSADLIADAFAETRRSAASGTWTAVAMWTGLVFAVLNLASAMAQIERGANRIYGIERDRPFAHKYARSLLLALAAGMPMVGGFLALVAGDAVGDALVEALGWSAGWLGWWHAMDIPAGVLLAWVASAVILRWSPRRVQPGYTWLAFGSAVQLVLWVGATWLLTVYVERSGTFGALYGPLTAFVALLLWANLTGVALFLGIAFAAQLEAARAGLTEPVRADPGPGGEGDAAVFAEADAQGAAGSDADADADARTDATGRPRAGTDGGAGTKGDGGADRTGSGGGAEGSGRKGSGRKGSGGGAEGSGRKGSGRKGSGGGAEGSGRKGSGRKGSGGGAEGSGRKGSGGGAEGSGHRVAGPHV